MSETSPVRSMQLAGCATHPIRFVDGDAPVDFVLANDAAVESIAAELAGYRPRVVHVDTANRQVDEVTAELLATEQRDPAPHRYVEVPAS